MAVGLQKLQLIEALGDVEAGVIKMCVAMLGETPNV